MTKKTNKSLYSNIINMRNKFKVSMTINKQKINKEFKTEKQALNYRNQLWKQHKPLLYKINFEPEEYKKEILEIETNKNKEKDDNINLNIKEKIKLQPGTIPIQNCLLKLIWLKQNNCCALCDKDMKLSDDYEIDHILAKCYNGPHELYNLQTLCINCHKIKTDTIDRNISKYISGLSYLSIEEKIIRIKLKMKQINYEIKEIIN